MEWFDSFVVSVTTYPARFEIFKRSFKNTMELFCMDQAWKIVVVLDDNLSEGDYSMYQEFLHGFKDHRIELIKSEAKWGSANKLIPVYNRYGQELPIVCFDDDKMYPPACLVQLLRAHGEYRRLEKCGKEKCVIAQEINPLVVGADGSVGYFNDLDVKLGQFEHGKYLSNACLFPKGCFGDGKLLNDYGKFLKVTNGKHDELWFWAVSTVNGVGSVGLANTMGYCMDGCVCMDCGTALTDVNSRPTEVEGYNRRLNETLGKEMADAMKGHPVTFFVTRNNYLATLYGMTNIFCLYNGQEVKFLVDDILPESFHAMFLGTVYRFPWRVPVLVERKDFNQ